MQTKSFEIGQKFGSLDLEDFLVFRLLLMFYWRLCTKSNMSTSIHMSFQCINAYCCKLPLSTRASHVLDCCRPANVKCAVSAVDNTWVWECSGITFWPSQLWRQQTNKSAGTKMVLQRLHPTIQKKETAKNKDSAGKGEIQRVSSLIKIYFSQSGQTFSFNRSALTK